MRSHRTAAGAQPGATRAHASLGHRSRRRGNGNLRKLGWIPVGWLEHGVAAPRHGNTVMGATSIAPSGWSALRTRVSNRLARHFGATPFRLSGTGPMVSFTFDDIPKSAAAVGAPMLEEYGARGTFYVSGGLTDQWSGHWIGASADDIVGLHRNGHEVACHTFSHLRTSDLDATAMTAEMKNNRRFLLALDPSIKLENFAYPYGFGSVSRKRQLGKTFRSSRGILPGVNSGTIDLHFLRG